MTLKAAATMPTNDRDWQRWVRETFDMRFVSGSGDPNGVFLGNRGQVFLRSDTGDVYKKTTDNVNTGWVAL